MRHTRVRVIGERGVGTWCWWYRLSVGDPSIESFESKARFELGGMFFLERVTRSRRGRRSPSHIIRTKQNKRRNDGNERNTYTNKNRLKFLLIHANLTFVPSWLIGIFLVQAKQSQAKPSQAKRILPFIVVVFGWEKRRVLPRILPAKTETLATPLTTN